MALEFQIYDFTEDHETLTNDMGEEIMGNYIINIFGRTLEGKSVYAKVLNYTPYFYIDLPESWGYEEKIVKKKLETLYNWLKGKENKKIWGKYKDSLLEINLMKKKKIEGFTNDKEFYFARLVFNNSVAMKKFSYFFDSQDIQIYSILPKPFKFKLYESNIAPMLRCFHILKISGCSWVSVENYKTIKKSSKQSYCNIEINVNWQELKPITKDNNAPLVIASFDIECYSHDGNFPQAFREKDAIIQIGVTYTKLGESMPYRKWVACLDKTDNIDDIVVESFDTEKEVIEAWIKEMNEQDCDIITGYNIFHFDEKYIYDRCIDVLFMKADISYLSKLKNKFCNFKEMKLESSALGQNILNFWETPGRVHIDLMKDVQKTFNLPSYKLDFVASNFIRGEIDSYKKINEENHFELKCKSVDDIQIKDYIHIEIIKGFISDDVGEKYLVSDIDRENKILYLLGDSTLDAELEIASKHGGKIFWSQAKDDVGPKDIFRMQKEGPAERAIVAKYCVKDCSLVNLLINKLEVVTKSIEMANVCYVPMGYLFIRGQGIKLFSLCLKEFREQGYIFPVIKVKKDEDGNLEREESYEGAIVFDPVPQIDYEANTTKDYASLYPSAILHKNMSHEKEVLDPLYDNLDGITYFNASFNENDGSTKYVRFAKDGDKLGVIPTILSNLLKERKSVKKLMKTEKNPFKYKILDAKQLAVKVTANSLYGQLGAATSPIANRNIAACTTSTGREMLLLAKKYDEEILPWLINGLKEAYKNNDEITVNKLLDLELKARSDNELIGKIKKYCSETIRDIVFQPVIRYGDSVASYTPIYIKHNNCIEICTIDQLAVLYGNNLWYESEDKEYCEINNILTWTNNGWTKLERVMRHKLANHKKMFRILTNTGIVDVTDDHSLLLESEKEISPKDLKIGMELLHCNLKLCLFDRDIGKLTFNNQLDTAICCKKLSDIDIEYYLDYEIDGDYNTYKITIIEDNIKYNPNEVVKIEEINYTGYVYDLTTSNHHFAAGIGNLIVHNTDSVFCCFRFRESCELLDDKSSLEIFKKIIIFGKELIKPFLIDNEKEIFVNQYDKYFSNITELSLPIPFDCPPLPTHNNIILPLEIRVMQFLHEYVYENYFSWLWSLQEIVIKNYPNLNNKLYDWVIYLLKKYRLNYNDLKEIRESEVIPVIMQKIELNYNVGINQYTWSKPTPAFIDELNKIINNLYSNNINYSKELKHFLENILKEEWICADGSHDPKMTMEKKKLKKERTFNNKQLLELIRNFIENNLKLTFDQYKIDHELKLVNFINNNLKNIYIQPWWDIIDDIKHYKLKIFCNGIPMIDKRTLEYSIELGILSGELVKSRLPFPHDLEYEKTFWPFLILTKKRYVGNKYEFNADKYKQDYMGIVLKRRDNSPIVKEICSGIIDYLINKKDPIGAKEFAEECLENMFNNKYDIKYFLQSRTLKLKESYKDWTKIAHVYLAEQLAQRDLGNKPQSGDRIEFAVVKRPFDPNADPKKKPLQGEIIEIPSYIKQNNIDIDYIFYMKNQIMKPALQFLKLVDPNAENMFKLMEEKYGIAKPIKVKKEPIVKVKKEPVVKVKKVSKKIIKTNDEPTLFKLKKSKKKVAVEEEIIVDNTKDIIVEETKIKKSKKKIAVDDTKDSVVVDTKDTIVEEPKIKKSKKKIAVEEVIVDDTKDSVIDDNTKDNIVEETKIKKSKKKIAVEEVIVDDTKDSIVEETKIKKSKKKIAVEEVIVDNTKDKIVEEPKIKKSKKKIAVEEVIVVDEIKKKQIVDDTKDIVVEETKKKKKTMNITI